MKRKTPSSVLYEDLKNFGRISNKLAVQKMVKARSGAARDASRISREIVDAEPGSDIRFYYRNLRTIADEMITMLYGNFGGKRKAYEKLLDHYGTTTSTAVGAMSEALESYDLPSHPYTNFVERISQNETASMREKCVFSFMLFLACAVYGDAEEAVQETEAAFRERLAMSIQTIQVQAGDVSMHSVVAPDIERLELRRIVRGSISERPYPLALPPERTTIGARDSSIMDVAADVSRAHLAIWYDGSRWVCQGLSSLNGTTLISGADKSVSVVELPRAQKGNAPSPICEIRAGDTLCLGVSTRFLVTSMFV